MQQYIGEIRLLSFPFAPKGWALCDGQLLSIQQNQALFSILGTTYGGNGQTNFALPDLRARVPAHVGGGLTLGQSGGEEAHTLVTSELPAHTHPVQALTGQATTPDPTNALWASTASAHYAAGAQTVMAPGALATVGGSQPHNNMPPFAVVSFAIALQGVFPSRN